MILRMNLQFYGVKILEKGTPQYENDFLCLKIIFV
jgi:hypothetical protein